MRVFLIDSENINFDNFIKSTNFKKKDHFYIVGNATLKFSLFTLEFLQKRKKVKFISFNEPSKDYADKIILTMLGFLLAKKKFKKCIIISNDNIFSKLDFTDKFAKKEVQILKVDNNKITPAKEQEYHIDLFKKNQDLITSLRQQSKTLHEFHAALQKHFKIHGTLIYRYLKQNYAEEFLFVKANLALANKAVKALEKPVLEQQSLEKHTLEKPAPAQIKLIENKSISKENQALNSQEKKELSTTPKKAAIKNEAKEQEQKSEKEPQIEKKQESKKEELEAEKKPKGEKTQETQQIRQKNANETHKNEAKPKSEKGFFLGIKKLFS